MFYSEYPEKSIEDFEVYEILGRGGFARVYRAKSLKTDQEVAIKIIDKKMTHHHGMTTRVRKEVELHSRLKHPSILELYTFFEDANYVYLVLEMCHNGELHRKIRENGPLSEEQAQYYLKQIIEGLKYLHSYNILHRDLTLANLLLTKDMKVKIADFGLATQLEAGVGHFTMCGTPNYISPEVVSRSKQGLEADVWSVGCMLYTMLVGKAPFDTKEIKGTLTRVQGGQFNIPNNIGENAKDLIIGLLQTNPDKRLNLQQLSMHKFLQTKKVLDLFQDTSITDSGIGSINKSHSNIDSKNSLREQNTFDNKFLSVSQLESRQQKSNRIKEVVDSQNHENQFFTRSSCSNFKNSSHELVNRSINSKIDFPSSVINSEIKMSYPLTKNPNEISSDYFLKNMSNHNTTASISSIGNYPCSVKSVNNKDCIKTEPLNSKRLRPIRQRTRNAILNILEDETVCIEFLKYLSNSNCDTTMVKINEVMCIDSTGQNVLVYSPQNIFLSDLREKPVPLESGNKISHFLFQSMSEKYLKKYELAKKFVDLVRSRTPKLTIYTNLAKVMLMENDPEPDLEIEVYNSATSTLDSGESCSIDKIHISGKTEISQVFYRDGKTINVDTSNGSKLFSPVNKWIDYSLKCKEFCQKITNSIESINEYHLIPSLYPITIGRKSFVNISHTDNNRYCNLVSAENLPPSILDLLSQQLKLSSTSQSSSVNISTTNTSLSDQCPSVFVPDVGWATQLANGELKVQFNDGCQLIIMYDCNQIERIKWFANICIDNLNQSSVIMKEFHRNDILPDEVHSKIELLPLFVKKLRMTLSQKHDGIS